MMKSYCIIKIQTVNKYIKYQVIMSTTSLNVNCDYVLLRAFKRSPCVVICKWTSVYATTSRSHPVVDQLPICARFIYHLRRLQRDYNGRKVTFQSLLIKFNPLNPELLYIDSRLFKTRITRAIFRVVWIKQVSILQKKKKRF